jgi:phage-related minor tail protein
MPDIAKLTVEVSPKGIAEAKKQLDELAKSGKETEKTTMSMMDKFRNMQAVMQGPVAAFGVLTRGMKQLYAAGKELTDMYAIQERAVSNLDAVLKATGGTVGLTSRELQEMAAAFQEVTLFGDEAIIGMNAVLLGFRSIQGDQFKRTTEAILDMSTVMGTDLVSAANMMGKALDSPTQGVSALSRVGFVFTEQQKELIKTLEESGDLLGAQEIILGEVEKAFGGAARAAGDTATGAFKQLNNALGDMKENLGRDIATWTEPFVRWLTDAITKSNQLTNNLRTVRDVLNSGATGQATDTESILTAYDITQKAIENVDRQLALALENQKKSVNSSRVVREAIQQEIDTLNNLRRNHVAALAAMETMLNTMSGDIPVGAPRRPGAGTTVAPALGVPKTDNDFLKERGKEAMAMTVYYNGLAEAATRYQEAELSVQEQDMVMYFKSLEQVSVLYRENVKETTKEMAAFEQSILNIDIAMQDLIKQGFVDSFMQFGEALASGANAGESLVMSMANMGIQMLNQLPMLLLNAGLQAIIANPYSPVGYALIGASGIVAIGAGAANYARNNPSVEANALGGVYNSPSLSAYSGGVYNSPQTFAFAKGAGIFGEAGPEAIMPLSRGADGKLGVKASGSSVSVVINNNASGAVASAAETTNADGSKQIVVTVENIMRNAIANGRLDSAMSRYGARPLGVRG